MNRERGDSDSITQLLQRVGGGDRRAIDEVFCRVHAELLRIAKVQLLHERPDHTLTPTALVNESYLKLVAHAPGPLADRRHFFAIAARAMRQVLVNHALQRAALKRGGDLPMITFDESRDGGVCRATELIALDGALQQLNELDPDLGQIVEYRFFAGLSQDDIASLLGLSPSTVGRRWRTARAWLRKALA